MRIGVITPAHDVAPYIADAIGSVLAQTHTDWRMVVVDDGSHDQTADVVARRPDPRIDLIRQLRGGVSAARNRGIGALDAAALLFLDADDWLAPDAMAVLAATLEASPWAAAAAGAYAPVRTDRSLGPVRRPPGGDHLERMLVRNPFANGGHLLIRQEAVAAAGWFRADLRYGEDWEYWVRVALQGEFVTTRERHPLCFVRERRGSAYRRMASDPNAFAPCLQAIFTNPDLRSRIGAAHLAVLRQRAEAENAWVVGRELIRHGHDADGLEWLRRSAVSEPSPKRLAIAAAAGWAGLLPEDWRGPFRPYEVSAAE